MLKAAGASLPALEFFHLYLDLREQTLADEASILLKEAADNPAAPQIIRQLKSYGWRREARELGLAARHKKG